MKIHTWSLACYCILGVFFLGCSEQKGKAIPQPVEQGTPELTLSLQHLDIETEQLVLLLEAVNQGEHPLVITRLEEGVIEKHGLWKGWYVQVKDLDGRPFGPLKMIWDDVSISEEELSQLLPGEQFSVRIYLGAWQLTKTDYGVDNEFYKPVTLLRESGVYDITIRLNIFTDMLVGSPTPVSWTGEVFSNTVQVEIQYRDSPIPKRLSYPERALQKHYVCQCRVVCDRTIPENPCLQLPEDQQSQLASAEADRRRDAATLARANAVNILGGTPKKYQPCFCSDNKGEHSGKDFYPN